MFVQEEINEVRRTSDGVEFLVKELLRRNTVENDGLSARTVIDFKSLERGSRVELSIL